MCGIAGIISVNGIPQHSALKSMLNAMDHRGPDDYGVFYDEHAALGMTRLAILDTTALGHQPMQSHCKRYWIVYNGECYNHWLIRLDLEKLGDKFISGSDTETVLQSYVRWGDACLEKLNGMFAFAIWDTQEKTLFVARDRLGIKPFYYAVTEKGFVFASEIKGLLASGCLDLTLDSEAVIQYFTFGHIQQPLTILKGAKALMPGTTLRWKKGLIAFSSYWNFDQISRYEGEYEQAKSRLMELITDAVHLQLLSDRPLGVFLSGGLDSAAILAGMGLNNNGIKAYTIGFEENQYARNEAEEAHKLANHFGVNHQSVVIGSSEVLEALPDYFAALDQPSLDGLNTFLVSRYARQQMTVALSGLGGDELFAGYSRHTRMGWKLHAASWLTSHINEAIPLQTAFLQNKLGELAFRLKSYLGSQDVLRNYQYMRVMDTPGQSRSILKDDFIRRNGAMEFVNAFAHLDTCKTQGWLNRVLCLDIKSFMGSQLLRDMDAVSMSHSLEVRFPLTDHRIVEFAFSLPDAFKLNWDFSKKPPAEGVLSYGQTGTKKILLDALRPILPDDFADRAKNGFKLPLHFWLKQFSKEKLTSMIFDEKLYWNKYCSETAVNQLLDGFWAGRVNVNLVWKVITFILVVSSLHKIKRIP